jgi:diguanylate cyclase (GGDEF)-like protein/PAS domain S-box-containing protein
MRLRFARASRARRGDAADFAGSLRIPVLLACAVAVVAGMLVVTDRARDQADRARQAQVMMERVRSLTQQANIATLRSRATSDTGLRAAVREGFDGYFQAVNGVRRLRTLGVPPEQMRAIERGVGVAYGVLINAMGVSRVDPQAARHMALTTVVPTLERLAASTGRAATRQDEVARAALLRARIATTTSLGVGLALLILLGWWLHLQQRNSALAEQARAAERRGEERLHALVRHSSDVVAVIDPFWRVRWMADSVRTMLGYEPDTLVGRQLSELIHPDDAPRAEHFLGSADDADSGVRTISLRLRNDEGEYRHLELVSDNRLSDPLIDGILLNIRDVSERLSLLAQLHHQAFHDELTGLANRALLRDRLTHALARLRRHGGCLAVIFLDLDDFKTVNDGLGHMIGDELLRTTARRLEAALRTQDTAARLGGDEFAVVLEDLAGEPEALQIAERVRRALEPPVALAGREVTISMSIGVTCAAPGDDVDDLLRNADVAMYAAKKRGKARIAAFAPAMHQDAVERFELSGELSTVLARDELVLDYQPLVALERGTIVGFEALLRWEHPSRGRLGPDRFISLAESNGLIVPIGAWVMRTACAQLRRWLDSHPALGHLGVSVNVSARQVADGSLPSHVRAALQAARIAPEQLTLEITEALLVEDDERMQHELRKLKDIGVRLAVDDFGTGYSALSYLRSFPLDVLKVDRSFVAGIDQDGEKASLVRGIIEMAHNLSLAVVTEGIETPAEAALARELRSDYGQGYWFARPADPAVIDRLLTGDLSVSALFTA